MARHRKQPVRTPVPFRAALSRTDPSRRLWTCPVRGRARRGLTVGLAGASAVAATLLVLTVSPAAPPAPDRVPVGSEGDVGSVTDVGRAGERP